jgi:hypothetical protein
MVSAFRTIQEQDLIRPSSNGGATSATVSAAKEIPYDFVANFTLNGKPGNRHLEVFNISTDGAFVAVSIAYSFELARLNTATRTAWGSNRNVQTAVNALSSASTLLGTSSADTFENAFQAFINPGNVIPFDPRYLLLRFLDVRFLYSIIDSGSGRELQNLPIPNLAGLGNADGDRPFRNFPKPMLFLPRSTIRIEVEEVSEGLFYDEGVLSIVLHGYKLLGYGS